MANAGVNDPHGATLVINSIAKPRATHNFVLPLLKTHSPHPDPGKLTSKLVLSVAMRAWIAGDGNPRSISGFWMKGDWLANGHSGRQNNHTIETASDLAKLYSAERRPFCQYRNRSELRRHGSVPTNEQRFGFTKGSFKISQNLKRGCYEF
jgi:hypothetical protein